MSREIQLNIALTPIVEYDNKTERHIIYYEQFPQAIATGRTADEAEINLIHILEVMWKEQKEDLQETLKKNYIKDIHTNKPIKMNLA